MTNHWQRTRRPAITLIVLGLIAFSGCGSDDALESPTAAKLKGLGNFYLELAANKGGKGPANEQEFKKHLRSIPDFVLSSHGLDSKNIDAGFVSERDGEPFVVIYGITISGISGTTAPLVAHEKTGKNGKRLVAFANGKIDLVDEARLQSLQSAKQ
jgi:hypothetical protein